jgi:ABC-type Fe3+ transport system permease subunit
MTSSLAFEAPLDPMLQRRHEIQAQAAASLRRRKLSSKLAVGICWLFLGIAIVPLVAVVAYVVAKGLPAWTSDFFAHPTTPEGIPGGGVWNAICIWPSRKARSPRPYGSPPTS